MITRRSCSISRPMRMRLTISSRNNATPRAQALEAKLREICNPEEVDRRAKADQRKMAEYWGGANKLIGAEQILFTPPPGVSAADAWAITKQ